MRHGIPMIVWERVKSNEIKHQQEYHWSIQCLMINHGHVAMDEKI